MRDRTDWPTSAELKGKVCLVIGGGSIAPGWGIGKAIAVAYARAGAAVAVCDVNLLAAQETVDIIRADGGEALALEVDATDADSVGAALQATADAFGAVHVVHNNVGIGKAGDPAQTSAEDWQRIANANLLALHVTTQAALPFLKLQGGTFLTTSTIGSLRHIGVPHLAYGATKAAANHFSRLVAVEYASLGIRSNVLVVGLVDTPRIQTTMKAAYGGNTEEMTARRSRQVPLGFMGDAWDVAHAAVFLASDKARFISGAELVIDGALTATTRTA